MSRPRKPPPEAVFAALADPTRRRVLDQLSARGPLSATELSAHYPISRQALTKHLNTLAQAGLVRSARHGREVLYVVEPSRLSGASAWLDEVGRRWDQRLAALKQQLT